MRAPYARSHARSQAHFFGSRREQQSRATETENVADIWPLDVLRTARDSSHLSGSVRICYIRCLAGTAGHFVAVKIRHRTAPVDSYFYLLVLPLTFSTSIAETVTRACSCNTTTKLVTAKCQKHIWPLDTSSAKFGHLLLLCRAGRFFLEVDFWQCAFPNISLRVGISNSLAEVRASPIPQSPSPQYRSVLFF